MVQSYSNSHPGVIHDDLKVFLMNNVPQGKKKSKVALGVTDTKLGSAIQETLNIQCQSGGYTWCSAGLLELQSHKIYLSW